MHDESNPWGLPDWRDPEQYPKHNNDIDENDEYYLKKIKFWKWEFIRRCPEYQKDWIKFNSNRDVWKKKDKEGKTKEGKVLFKYGLAYLDHPNPDLKNPFLLAASRTESECVPATCKIFVDQLTERARVNNNYIAIINPRLPLENQYVRITKEIEEWEDERISTVELDKDSNLVKTYTSDGIPDYRQAISKYTLYIRLLDSRQDPSKPTWDAITEHLNQEKGYYGKSKESLKASHRTAKKYLKKARQW